MVPITNLLFLTYKVENDFTNYLHVEQFEKKATIVVFIKSVLKCGKCQCPIHSFSKCAAILRWPLKKIQMLDFLKF